MEGTGVQGWPRRELLLLLLCVSGLRSEGEEEELRCLQEGKDLSVLRHYNRKYRYTLKAWQRVEAQGLPKTLVKTETRNEDLNRAQVGRFLLEDDPTSGFVTVTMTGVQRQDVGLYQCVLLLEPLYVLQERMRLVLCPDPSGTHASDTNPTPNLAKNPDLTTMEAVTPTLAGIPTLSTTETLSTVYTRTVTQPLPQPTAVGPSHDPELNFTNGTSVTRVPFIRTDILVACGLVSKSLVFTVLFAVTWQSFGP